ncbi:DUF1294 domain-containing protein [Microbulbifer sp. CAU 1566]|uniref:DUF1294 domain-containing protein n=1 Tax=Microbulbifer sp. CAU 1566 TaxID=2933269 RepID=UPI0020044EFB|nr:DUF1294 domain-containing protein [Microbulbifer sp. CAU 1566]MCK7598934.1 DUF1294 domain-containing protein [Microbulbifer sp. CAU 1566]
MLGDAAFAQMALPLLGYLALLNLLTYGLYAWDKSAARRGAWRIKENTLHTLALAGGWPAALIARHRLRHKTRKQPFRSLFWITVIANIAILLFLLTPEGNAFLHSLLSALPF